MPGIVEFLQGLLTGQPPPGYKDYNDPMSYGMDMPQQGGITGQDYPIPPPFQDQSQFPGLPEMGQSSLAIGGQQGIPPGGGQDIPLPPPQQQGIMNNPVLNPTVDPSYADIGLEQGPMTEYTGTGAQAPQGQSQGFDEEAFRQKYMSQYKPQHDAEDYYNQLMMQYPTRNMHPGIMRRLAASFAGFGGGPNAAEEVMDQPFNRERREWLDKMGPAYNAANLERYGNVNERQILSQEARAETADRRAKTQEEDLERKRQKDYTDASIKRARIGFNYYKLNHPNAVFKSDDEGNVFYLDPQNPGEAKYVQDPDGDNVNVGKLGDAAKEEIKINNKLKEIKAKTSGKIEEIGAKGEEDRKTKREFPPAAQGGKPKVLTPEQQAQERLNRANELLMTDPEAAKYITITGKTVKVDVPSAGWGSNTPEQKAYAAKARDYILNGKRGEELQLRPMPSHKRTMTSQSMESVQPIAKNQTKNTSNVGSKTKAGGKDVTAEDSITVRRKSDGKLGNISRKYFNPDLYELAQ